MRAVGRFVTYHIPVPQEQSGIELDEFLCLSFPLLNKGYLRRQVREGKVLVDGNPALPSQRLKIDQVLYIDFEEPEDMPAAPVAPRAQVPVLFENEDVLVVDKPAGLAVEPERWERGKACLAGALLELTLDRSGWEPTEEGETPEAVDFRPRLVHRIDKDTSGAVLVAKHLEAERELRSAFESGGVSKHYLALVEGEYREREEEDIIDLPIAPDAKKSGRMRISEKDGKPSRTRVEVAEAFRGFTLLACEPITGRTHQIRVHLREIGFPLCVDPVYGRRDALLLSEIKPGYKQKRGRAEQPLIDRLTLHAHKIRFPGREGDIEVEAPVPRDLERVLKQMRKVRPPRTGRGGSA